MNYIYDLIYRLRAGESARSIARDLKVSRPTVHQYKLWAEDQGFLEPEQTLLEWATDLEALGPPLTDPETRRPVFEVISGREPERRPFDVYLASSPLVHVTFV